MNIRPLQLFYHPECLLAPKNKRSLKHKLEASRVPEAGLEPARL